MVIQPTCFQIEDGYIRLMQKLIIHWEDRGEPFYIPEDSKIPCDQVRGNEIEAAFIFQFLYRQCGFIRQEHTMIHYKRWEADRLVIQQMKTSGASLYRCIGYFVKIRLGGLFAW